MKRFLVPAVVIGLVLVLSAGLTAQTGQRMFERVTPFGTETVVEYTGTMPSGQSLQNPLLTPPGLVWNYQDNGLAWIARKVSIGDRGTQVLGVLELNNERVELFSVFDGNPPTPVWTDTSIYNLSGFMCDSSFTGDYHVVSYHSGGMPMVNGYNSSSSTPLWTWSYGTATTYAAKVAIDREGTIIAVAAFDKTAGILDLFFLDPATGAVQSTYSQASKGLRGFDLSADGSTLYFHDGAYKVDIFDIATLTVVYTATTGGSFDGHGISGDGTKFAFGGFGNVKIFEKIGGSWSSWTYNLGSGRYGDEMDFSDDGSTLGFGVSQYSPNYGKTEAYILDIATQTVTAHVVNTSNGVYQDVCSAAAISHDGKYFTLGRWGDQMNANPELQILENGVGLVASIDTRGSVFGADTSWDGQAAVSGCKSVHANVSGNGGDVDCYDLGNEDMDFLGTPSIGNNIQIDVYTNPSWYFVLLLGNVDDPNGFATFGYGTLYLDTTPPNLFIILPLMSTDPSGKGTLNGFIPNDPLLVGLTLYLQALFSPGGSQKALSNDYLTVTILP